MTTLSPWINFNGNTEEAFAFYKSVFGGDFTNITRFKDLAGPGFQISEKEADKIMRIVLPIGNGSTLIGNDVPDYLGRVSENENRSKIHIAPESKEEADRIFAGLSAGGEVEVPPGDGAFFAMFRDKYGIEWVVEFAPTKES
ncbi:MAG TPA: VOC family protein [Thermodesulfobacteriota bacterium]|nr:VOC family protein [Thermodesulfobacteriota bacterium]